MLIKEIHRLYRFTVKHNPFDSGMYKSLAEKYMGQNKYRAAEICLRKALWFTPEDPLVLNQLGNIYLKLRDLDNAARCFQAAIRYNEPVKGAL